MGNDKWERFSRGAMGQDENGNWESDNGTRRLTRNYIFTYKITDIDRLRLQSKEMIKSCMQESDF